MSAKRCPGGKEQEERSVCSEDSVVHRPGVRMGARAGGQGARWPRRCRRTEARLEPNEDQAAELGFTPRFKEEQPAGGDVIHAPPRRRVLWPGGARRWEALVKGAALPSRRLPCGRGKCAKAPQTPSSRHRQMLCRASAERQALGGRAASPRWTLDRSSASSLRAFGEGGSAAGWGHWAQKALTARPAGRSGELPEDSGGENGAQMEGERFLVCPACRLFFFLFLTTRVKYRTYG